EVSEDFTESVPTATGDPATDLMTNAYYRGALSLTSHSANATSGTTKEDLENDILSQGDMIFLLNITNNNLKWASYYSNEVWTSTDEEVSTYLEGDLRNSLEYQVLKSGSKYSVNKVYDGGIYTVGYTSKSYIEFTISGDNISITCIEGFSWDNVADGGNYKFSYKTTYEGTLTNYTPTTPGM
ncbi:hypothetical protein, partial [Brachyspira catarrhinii]|uniref:hypothetical protein n=1 Tax=Brachyspira catarrhinii TaxID=2528966 RepID=UPI0013866CA8